MKRPLHFFVEAVFAVVFLGGIALGGVLWHLNQNPADLRHFLPDIEGMLSELAPGLSFDISRAVLEPGEDGDLFGIRVYDIHVQNSEKHPIGSLEDMLLGFSWRNLAHFSFLPARINIEHPTIQITRFTNGQVGFDLKATEDDTQKADLPELAFLLAHAPDVLKTIQVRDAWIQFVDQKTGQKLEADKGLFVLERQGSGATGTLSLNAKSGTQQQSLRGSIDYDPIKNITHFNTAIKGLMLDQLMPFFPAFPLGLDVAMPLDALISVGFDANFHLIEGDLRLVGKTGKIQFPPAIPNAIAFSELMARLHYDATKNTVDVQDVALTLGRARLKAQAQIGNIIANDDANIVHPVTLTGLLENMPVDDLDTYWPPGIPGPREWIVDHLHHGTASRAAVVLVGNLQPDDTLHVSTLDGKIAFKDVTVDYLPPMPEVKNVTGEAQFDHDNFNIAIDSGKMRDTEVKKGDIRITDLTKSLQNIAINLDLDGPVQDAMVAVSSKPLQFLQRLELTPEQFSGTSKTALFLRFPLLHHLRLDQVEMTSQATLSDVIIRNIIKDLTLTATKLDFSADTSHLQAKGDVKLADAPAQLDWQELFSSAAPNSTVISLQGDVTSELLKGLRLPVDDYLKGTAKANVALHQDKQKIMHVKLDSDLTGADIAIPQLNITKKAGTNGKLALLLDSQKNGPMSISNLNAEWPQFHVSNGAVRWAANGDLASATLKGVQSGRTQADIIVTPMSGLTHVSIDGAVVDLSGYWTSPSSENTSTQRMDIALNTKALYLDPVVPLQNVKADLSLRGSELLHGNLTAQIDHGDLSLKQTEAKDGARQLSVVANNAGGVLSALDATDKVNGGILKIEAQSTAHDPTALAGTMTMDGFTIARAPVLARLINAFSPGGLIDLLNGHGLEFSKLKSDFVLEEPKTIHLKNGRMSGSSLGLSFSGRIYRDTQTVKLSGTIIPIQGLNKIVSKIPLIGQILTGIKGEGLIAAKYKITGPTSDPEVTVNPLSVLTPGIFRSIFFSGSDE